MNDISDGGDIENFRGDPGFFEKLAPDGVQRGLTRLDVSARQAPEPFCRRAAALDQEDLAILEDCRADRGSRKYRAGLRGDDRRAGPRGNSSLCISWHKSNIRV